MNKNIKRIIYIRQRPLDVHLLPTWMENIFNCFLLKYFNKSIIFWLLYTFLSVVLDAHLSDQKVGAVCRIFRHLQGIRSKN